MSNMIDSFTSASHAKQGFYGKQLKIIGSCPSSPTTGAELDLIVKVLCGTMRMTIAFLWNRTNTALLLSHSPQCSTNLSPWLYKDPRH